MADRDLLNKPLPLVVPEERHPDKKNLPAPPPLGKLGVRPRARDVGGEPQDTRPAPGAAARAGRAPAAGGAGPATSRTARQARDAQAPADAELGPQRAHRAAYFNRDVEATAAPNLRARPAAALRGEEGAADLRRVVLPPPAGGEAPASAEQMGALAARMAADAPESLALTDLLGRHGAWTRDPKNSAEGILARIEQLEAMVADRRAALARMATLEPDKLARSPTLTQALLAEASPPALDGSLEARADQMVRQAAQGGAGLHARLLKVTGSRRG